jgi:hypothetical protein
VPAPDRFVVWKAALALSLLLLLADGAFAYVGPGAGLELVGYFMSLLAWVAAAFSAVMLYPCYALVRRLRGRKAKESQAPLAPSVPEPGRDPASSPP